MNLSLRIRRGIMRAKANGRMVGRKPIPRKAVKLMRQFKREGSSIRTITVITGYSTGAVSKYVKGVRA